MSGPDRGCFIAFEGGEGAGKSSAIAMLSADMQARNIAHILTREPGGTPEGQAIRALVVEKRSEEWDPVTELLLIMADRAQHVARRIRPALAAGRHVLCDRFVGSTIAYQGAGKGLDASLILRAQEIAAGDLSPDLTVLLDIDPATGLERSTRRLNTVASREGRFESLDLDFHRRVRQSFLDQAVSDPARWIVIDAAPSQERVSEEVLRRVNGWLAAQG